MAERYDDVLDEPQRRFVADYAALPQPSQALLARLLLRRGPWFRASGLIYEEIGPAETAAAPLEALGWLDRDAAMTPDELFGLHTKPELLRLFPIFPRRRARPSCWTRCAPGSPTRNPIGTGIRTPAKPSGA